MCTAPSGAMGCTPPNVSLASKICLMGTPPQAVWLPRKRKKGRNLSNQIGIHGGISHRVYLTWEILFLK